MIDLKQKYREMENKDRFISFLLPSFQETPPPLPKSRPYTVLGNMKMGFPQNRIMKMDYPGEWTMCFIIIGKIRK